MQCSECHTTGWLSRLAPASHKLSNRLEEILQHLVQRAQRGGAPVCRGRLAPAIRRGGTTARAAPVAICSTTGGCQACGHDELVAVFRTTGTRSRTRGNVAMTCHDSTCPACGQRDRQLLGARNATLGAQVVAESWASPFNDDKKLIAFSDSVQDAAHRAGFFGARTYINTVRIGHGAGHR